MQICSYFQDLKKVLTHICDLHNINVSQYGKFIGYSEFLTIINVQTFFCHIKLIKN